MFKQLLTTLKNWIGISEQSSDAYSGSITPLTSQPVSTFDSIVAELPALVSDDERIARVIFIPDHVGKANISMTKSLGVKPYTFKSRGGEDDLSTNRFDYTTADFCKSQGKKIEIPTRKDYFGIAIILASEIRETGAEVEYTPDRPTDNPFHSSIRIGFVNPIGKELSGENQRMVNAMAKKARAYKDEDVNNVSWVGETNLI